MSDNVMVLVGDIIEAGQPIPAGAVAVDDKVGDGWAPRPGSPGCWYCVRYDGEPYDLSDTIQGDALSKNWGPLTVTAVREPEPAPEHCGNRNYIHEPHVALVLDEESGVVTRKHCPGTGPDGLPVDGGPDDGVAVREPERKVERAGWPEQAAEEPDEVVHYRIPGDASALTLCGLDVWADGTSVTEHAGSANCVACRAAADEDKLPAPSVLLDLVRQYGAARLDAHRTFQLGALDLSAGHRATASELLDRIAALVPQQDRYEPHVDGPREPTEQERADHDLMSALDVEQLDEVLPAIDRLKMRVDHLRNWRSEHDKRERERDEARAKVERLRRLLKEQASNFAAAAVRANADPSVLSLPQVPAGTVALIGGTSGRRFTRVDRDGPKDWWNADDGRQSLTSLLELEGSVTVVKREPRTWPRIPAESDMPRKVTVNGEVYEIEPGTNGYINQEHGGSSWSLPELRVLGDVTEVVDDATR